MWVNKWVWDCGVGTNALTERFLEITACLNRQGQMGRCYNRWLSKSDRENLSQNWFWCSTPGFVAFCCWWNFVINIWVNFMGVRAPSHSVLDFGGAWEWTQWHRPPHSYHNSGIIHMCLINCLSRVSCVTCDFFRHVSDDLCYMWFFLNLNLLNVGWTAILKKLFVKREVLHKGCWMTFSTTIQSMLSNHEKNGVTRTRLKPRPGSSRNICEAVRRGLCTGDALTVWQIWSAFNTGEWASVAKWRQSECSIKMK